MPEQASSPQAVPHAVQPGQLAPAAGTVFFVGAGPGNPDLLTIRAREVLSHNATAVVDPDVLPGVRDIIAASVPVPQEKIDQADKDYQALIEEAKESGARRKPPRPAPPTAANITDLPAGSPQLAELLAQLVADGEDVVRLVAGNPLSRESVLAEINSVATAGVDFQVVPGMSLPSTVPAFAGIALGSAYTEMDVTVEDVDWDQLAGAPQPLVLQARKEDLPTIAAQLQQRGLAASMPASVTVNGTTRLQRTFDVTLGTLGKLDAELDGALVVTLGTAVDDRSKYSWWENRPLYGWRVLVPRAKSQAAPMSARLATHGAIPQEVPTISLEPPRNPLQMERSIKGIVEGRYQWIVFTSVNAVDAVWEKIAAFGLDARAFAGVHLAAVGQKTAQAIRDLGLTPEVTPPVTRQNAHGLVEVFPEYVEDLDPVGRVLLPRADLGSEVLVEGLKAAGWEVDDVVAYRTVRAAPPSAEVRDMIKSGGFDAVCFTSSSTVKNLVGIAGKPHRRTIIAAIGPAAAHTAREMGLRVDVVPEVADIPSLVDALAAHVAALRAAGQLPPPRKKRRARRKPEAAAEQG
ncbi:bifunctional uroporphyrinogen-III C-methyltransferase/uroporphyrinogen-III synthase [Corynebacterium uberis]|uniref:uroporphyrinogen-III synthase n=1 Tax=Corynebacterium TaxID=1716 RepID=UPI001D0B2657|nr:MULTISPECIES: uroporphyrinogen-III synthase [Corynebacterium]MCZ9309518.1 uroporphyrinogen-III synthase [Corynebacterium sp. c6VSa_13]UDL74764.1 uroporphyrinogen-III synthase [Corynebacterium uberis]UDL76889.1 uroporphyrinogen-III synthase [Corynebacterium uberis]UDL79101.1 uroporphyrinogen-III synthase [Corynebacterium uberis]UDL81304.1 uroporphyrinogen-III synthase [Corynebacterium uberis]